MGPAHDGVEFLKGSVTGSEKFAIFPVQQAGVEKVTLTMSSLVKIDEVCCDGGHEIEDNFRVNCCAATSRAVEVPPSPS